MAGRNTVVTGPKGKKPGSGGSSPAAGSGTSAPAAGATSGGSTGSSGTSGSSGGSGGAGGARKIGQSYLDQAANLAAQAKAIRYALKHSYGDALSVKLQNVEEILAQQDKSLLQGYRQRVRSLAGSVEDNTKAQDTQTQGNTQNLARERSNILSEVLMQGAGESDALAAQAAALRNWQANQAEVQRSAFDTLRSINANLNDLTIDTKSARLNVATQAEADKEQLWTAYYNQRAEALTNLGNTYGQMADYRDQAKAYGVGSGGGTKKAANAFMRASKELGKAYENPGAPKELRKWKGREEFENTQTSAARLEARPTVSLGQAPEGATLRKW